MSRPILIAHRGASGYRPEHSRAAYALAIAQGADYIEPDLVFSKDGHLIVRHENNITDTTNVAELAQFADRKTQKVVDGAHHEGWFTEDFTLAELKSLRLVERLKDIRPHNRHFDLVDEILTFDEVLAIANAASAAQGRTIGIYPETKHPTYFMQLGYDFDAPLLASLAAHDRLGRDSGVFIQSFEVSNLRRLATQCDVPLIQLLEADGQPYDAVVAQNTLTYQQMMGAEGLAEIAQYASGIGPNKASVWHDGTDLGLVARAHDVGLQVHPWTFRAEDQFLDPRFRGRPMFEGLMAELNQFLDIGIDGGFCDFPDIFAAVVRARNAAQG